jgi:hypothetical protein
VEGVYVLVPIYRRGIKVTVIIIMGNHGYELHMKPILFSED